MPDTTPPPAPANGWQGGGCSPGGEEDPNQAFISQTPLPMDSLKCPLPLLAAQGLAPIVSVPLISSCAFLAL